MSDKKKTMALLAASLRASEMRAKELEAQLEDDVGAIGKLISKLAWERDRADKAEQERDEARADAAKHTGGKP